MMNIVFASTRANVFQSAFTNWCPMMLILRKSGVPDSAAPAHR